MRAEVMQITVNCQNSTVTSKAPKFRGRLTNEFGLDKGYYCISNLQKLSSLVMLDQE